MAQARSPHKRVKSSTEKKQGSLMQGNGARKQATGALIRPEKLTNHNTRTYWEIY